MLRQIPSVYRSPDEPEKLWFTGEQLDLFIWVSEDDEVVKFQFTYDKPNNEKSVFWDASKGLIHSKVDDGTRPGKHPSSPILLDNVPIDKNLVNNLLKEQESVIPSKYFNSIQERILNEGGWRG